MNINKAQIAKIHYARNFLSMDDKGYRKFLEKFEVISSLDLEKSQFGQVMSEFCKLGFVDPLGEMIVSLESIIGQPVPEKQRGMFEIMAAHLVKIDKLWDYANAIAKKRFKVAHIIQCSHTQLYSINGNLMRHRNNGKTAGIYAKNVVKFKDLKKKERKNAKKKRQTEAGHASTYS